MMSAGGHRSREPVAQLIIEPKKGKDSRIEYVVNYHDKKSDNSFTITTTIDPAEALEKLKTTLEGEVQTLLQKSDGPGHHLPISPVFKRCKPGPHAPGSER